MNFIKVRVMSYGIAKIPPDRFKNLSTDLVSSLGPFLNFFEPFRKTNILRKIESAFWSGKSCHPLLAKILRSNAHATRPLISRSVDPVVDRGESEFIQPGRDGAFRRHV